MILQSEFEVRKEYFELVNLSGKNEIFDLPDHLFYVVISYNFFIDIVKALKMFCLNVNGKTLYFEFKISNILITL